MEVKLNISWRSVKKRLPFAVFNSMMSSGFAYLFSNLFCLGRILIGALIAGGVFVITLAIFLSMEESEGYTGAW